MHRALAIDVLACPHCGGRLRLIATLHDRAVIRRVCAHVGVGASSYETTRRYSRASSTRTAPRASRGPAYRTLVTPLLARGGPARYRGPGVSGNRAAPAAAGLAP